MLLLKPWLFDNPDASQMQLVRITITRHHVAQHGQDGLQKSVWSATGRCCSCQVNGSQWKCGGVAVWESMEVNG